MGWSSYIRTDCGIKLAGLGAAAGSRRGFAGAGGDTRDGTFHAYTAAESFDDGAAINRSARSYV